MILIFIYDSNMVVCICTGVSESDLKNLVNEGSKTLSEIQSRCGAGDDCGSCIIKLRRLLEPAKSEIGKLNE